MHKKTVVFPILFRKLKVGEAFRPAPGEKDEGLIFVKRLNGCCPRLMAAGESIFWPNDKVVFADVPKKLLEPYNV